MVTSNRRKTGYKTSDGAEVDRYSIGLKVSTVTKIDFSVVRFGGGALLFQRECIICGEAAPRSCSSAVVLRGSSGSGGSGSSSSGPPLLLLPAAKRERERERDTHREKPISKNDDDDGRFFLIFLIDAGVALPRFLPIFFSPELAASLPSPPQCS